MRHEYVFYRAPGSSKPYYVVNDQVFYGTDRTCNNMIMGIETHFSISHDDYNKYDAVVKKVYLSLGKEGIEEYGCKSMKAGKKYRIQWDMRIDCDG